MPRLQFHAYVNVERRILTDAAGDPLGGDRLLEFFREEAGVICFHCQNDDGTPHAFGISDAFEFGLATDWDQTTAVQILSEDDQFNISGDWDEDGVSQIDPTQGRICCRYSTNTAGFNTLFAGNAETVEGAGLYLKQIDPVAGNVTLCQYAANARNIRRTDGTTPPGIEAPTYPTYAQVLVILSVLYQGDWLIGTTYTAGQTVTHEGGFFLARRESTGSEPDITGHTLDWALLAAPGETGDASATGYTPTMVADWDATVPADVAAALDQAASRVRDLEERDRLTAPAGAVTQYRVYRNAAGTWELADPDTAACETCELFLSLGAAASAGMTAEAVVTNGAWAWTTLGAPLYLDDAGQLTETVPSSPDDDGRVGRIVGWVRSATSIRFDGHVPGGIFETTLS